MKSIFFVSDIHFGLHNKIQEKEKERRFLSFLDHVERKGEQLFIVGDLFDYWFEYKYVIPRGYHHVISKLGMLVERGVKVSYIAGNHDFWLGDFFPVDLGIPVYKNPIAVALHGKKFYLHHGDGLALRDTGYRILKKILRSRLNIFLFSLVHPSITAPIAKGSSRSSREYTSQKDYGESDGMIACAEKKIAEGFDVVIMGHRHHPASQSIGNGTYINLGDWITYHTYAEFNGTKVALKTWKKS
jgi:UDP-2,3-diacylglucosamine hydrolase